MSGYPVVEIIDTDRLMEVLARSVERARAARRKAREEYNAAYVARRSACSCCWDELPCDDCENF